METGVVGSRGTGDRSMPETTSTILAISISMISISCRSAAPAAEAAGPDLQEIKLAEFPETLERVKGTQVTLGERWAAAPDEEGRAEVREEARRFVTTTIVEDIFLSSILNHPASFVIKDFRSQCN